MPYSGGWGAQFFKNFSPALNLPTGSELTQSSFKVLLNQEAARREPPHWLRYVLSPLVLIFNYCF